MLYWVLMGLIVRMQLSPLIYFIDFTAVKIVLNLGDNNKIGDLII